MSGTVRLARGWALTALAASSTKLRVELLRRSVDLLNHDEDGQGGGDARGDADQCRAEDSNRRDQHEAGQDGADGSARRVDEIQGAGRARGLVLVVRKPSDGHRKRGAQRRRRDEDEKQARQQSNRGEQQAGGAIAIGPLQQRRQRRQLCGKDQRGGRDPGLQGDVDLEASPRREPCGHAASDRGAGSQSAQEGGDDGGGGGGRVSDVERQQSRPADFIDEAGESRAGVGDEKEPRHVGESVEP